MTRLSGSRVNRCRYSHTISTMLQIVNSHTPNQLLLFWWMYTSQAFLDLYGCYSTSPGSWWELSGARWTSVWCCSMTMSCWTFSDPWNSSLAAPRCPLAPRGGNWRSHFSPCLGLPGCRPGQSVDCYCGCRLLFCMGTVVSVHKQTNRRAFTFQVRQWWIYAISCRENVKICGSPRPMSQRPPSQAPLGGTELSLMIKAGGSRLWLTIVITVVISRI